MKNIRHARVDRINLYPKDLNSSFAVSRELQILIVFIVLLIGLSGLTIKKAVRVSKLKSDTVRVTGEINSIKREIAAVSPEAGAPNPMQKFEVAQKVLDHKSLWANILKEISLLTGPDVWLESLSSKIDGDQIAVSIVAESTTQKAMSDYLSNLENSYYFRNIRFKSSENIVSETASYFQFQIETLIPLKSQFKGEQK